MWIVDRLEGEYAVCEKEDGSFSPVSLSLFDGPVREGDCVIQRQGRFQVDEDATKARREQMKRQFSHLFGKRKKREDPSG